MKRDRWESSDDEEDDVGKGSSAIDTKKGSVTENEQPHSHDAASHDDGASKQTTSALHEASSEAAVVANVPLHNPLVQGCRSIYNCYERLARLEEGTYGVVWKARDLVTDEVVALKQIKFESELLKEGFPVAALREISVLLALSHECIVTVKEMVVGGGVDKVFMVMEYMEMDLQEAMKRSGSSPFPQSELKYMMHNILSATEHIHSKWYLHRDLKTSNILVHKSGKLCLCDFGLARKYQHPLKALTQLVITLWYRPPELLFGETVYGPPVDMWRYVVTNILTSDLNGHRLFYDMKSPCSSWLTRLICSFFGFRCQYWNYIWGDIDKEGNVARTGGIGSD
eukprot:scaffold4473_cov55-Attheya_sp.AAC.1